LSFLSFPFPFLFPFPFFPFPFPFHFPSLFSLPICSSPPKSHTPLLRGRGRGRGRRGRGRGERERERKRERKREKERKRRQIFAKYCLFFPFFSPFPLSLSKFACLSIIYIYIYICDGLANCHFQHLIFLFYPFIHSFIHFTILLPFPKTYVLLYIALAPLFPLNPRDHPLMFPHLTCQTATTRKGGNCEKMNETPKWGNRKSQVESGIGC